MATTGREHPTSQELGTAGSGHATLDDSRDRRAAGAGGGITQAIRDNTFRSLDNQKARASETLGSFAGAVRGMTQPLRDGGQTGVADYVNQAADGIERWASQMRQQDIEDAFRAVQQFARRQPALFLGIGFAVGVVAARFLKSSPTGASTGPMVGFGSSSGRRGREALGAGSSDIGAAGFSGGVAATDRGEPFRTGSSDIPRVSSDIRPAGEVL